MAPIPEKDTYVGFTTGGEDFKDFLKSLHGLQVTHLLQVKLAEISKEKVDSSNRLKHENL